MYILIRLCSSSIANWTHLATAATDLVVYFNERYRTFSKKLALLIIRQPWPAVWFLLFGEGRHCFSPLNF